ncbi:MAG: hypothetical protein AAFX78_05620 [Cyanobacteria bacterium J06638_20]
MAKRRNLKKEKALRNLEYARKFRKRGNSGRFGRRRFFNNNQNSEGNENEQENNSDSNTEGAAD